MLQIKILAVDDSESVLQAIEAMLRALGHHVTTARNGVEALEKLTLEHFDLLITDLNMPQMNGLTLVRTVRKQQGLQYVPIVVLTTEWSDTCKSEARSAGASAWITKPFKAEQLERVVSRMVRRRG